MGCQLLTCFSTKPHLKPWLTVGSLLLKASANFETWDVGQFPSCEATWRRSPSGCAVGTNVGCDCSSGVPDRLAWAGPQNHWLPGQRKIADLHPGAIRPRGRQSKQWKWSVDCCRICHEESWGHDVCIEFLMMSDIDDCFGQLVCVESPHPQIRDLCHSAALSSEVPAPAPRPWRWRSSVSVSSLATSTPVWPSAGECGPSIA